VNFIPRGKAVRGDEPQPGDEQIGDYTQERLLRMDQKFTARVERALECGAERTAGDEWARWAATAMTSP
jgi:hypothetical protein